MHNVGRQRPVTEAFCCPPHRVRQAHGADVAVGLAGVRISAAAEGFAGGVQLDVALDAYHRLVGALLRPRVSAGWRARRRRTASPLTCAGLPLAWPFLGGASGAAAAAPHRPLHTLDRRDRCRLPCWGCWRRSRACSRKDRTLRSRQLCLGSSSPSECIAQPGTGDQAHSLAVTAWLAAVAARSGPHADLLMCSGMLCMFCLLELCGDAGQDARATVRPWAASTRQRRAAPARSALAQSALQKTRVAAPGLPRQVPPAIWGPLCVSRPQSFTPRLCSAASLSLHAGDTTFTFPVGPQQVEEMGQALQTVLAVFAEKQAAARPKRYKSLEYKYAGASPARARACAGLRLLQPGVWPDLQTPAVRARAVRPHQCDGAAGPAPELSYLELFCNPNAATNAFGAKVLVTARTHDGVAVLTEIPLTALKADLDLCRDQATVPA